MYYYHTQCYWLRYDLIFSKHFTCSVNLVHKFIFCLYFLDFVFIHFQVSELASFWLLSLLQLPLVIYLMANTNTIILPLEWAINIPMTVFLLYEVITGVVALHLMIKAQGIKFHVSRLHPHFVQMREEGKDD